MTPIPTYYKHPLIDNFAFFAEIVKKQMEKLKERGSLRRMIKRKRKLYTLKQKEDTSIISFQHFLL